MARFAYEGGTNGLTVATVRAVTMALVLWLYCRLSGRPLKLPRATLLNLLGLGVLMAAMIYGNIGSVEFIPVGLAALTFFTYPPMIAVISITFAGERVSPLKLAAVAIAFLGLALMLGVSLQVVDPRGVALALLAAVATAWNAVWLARRAGHVDPFVLTCHLSWVAALILLAVALGAGQIAWPVTAGGWAGLVGVVALQGSAMPIYFLALGRIGALKSGVITNLQPVVSISAAYLLFGEVLTPLQFGGGALVLGGILLMQWAGRRD